jgi:hypothetical protein
MVSTLQKDTYNDEELGLLSDILTVCRETSRKMSNGVFAVFLRLQTLHHCQHGGGWGRGRGDSSHVTQMKLLPALDQ